MYVKLELVDDVYRKLLTDEARELLDSAGCAEWRRIARKVERKIF